MTDYFYSNGSQSFRMNVRNAIVNELLRTQPEHTGEWQSMDTTVSPVFHATRELLDVHITCDLPSLVGGPSAPPQIDTYFRPDLPWANQHFEERVSGQPLNPPPSHVNWPYAVRGNGDHTNQGKFDHTYPERYWARFDSEGHTQRGIRGTSYGDLTSLVNLLVEYPDTRQAYLPVWFPEDTGGHSRLGSPRVPCSLGYHFLIRDGKLTTRYYLRSCDAYRHMVNDLYLTARLALWLVDKYNSHPDSRSSTDGETGMISLSTMHTYISSMHSFVGDDSRVREMMDK